MLCSLLEPEDRAVRFAELQQMQLVDRLGNGWDGSVFATSRHTAIKAFAFEALYKREKSVYHRLQLHGATKILEFQVPEMLSTNDDLWILEMTIVRPPFVLDFAGAQLDQRPAYPDDVVAEWLEAKQEQFGLRWPIVRSVMSHFAGLGIYLTVVKPGNIEFARTESETDA